MSQTKSFFGAFGDRFKEKVAVASIDEAEQMVVRFIFAAFIISYSTLFIHSSDIRFLNIDLSNAQAFGLAYLALLLPAGGMLFSKSISRPVVRVAMMAIDLSVYSTAMVLIPELSIPFFFLYLWVILGNGFRYGNKYLFIAMGMSLVGFCVAYFTNNFWAEHRAFGAGIIFSIFLLSSYVSLFINRLNSAKEKLQQAVTAADEANAAKSTFLANMSHELRTPLNGVITVSDLLQETPLSKIQNEYVETIRSSSNTLLGLINDVLDFSKIESGRISLDNICFDLYACINDVMNIIRPLAEQKGLALHNNISNTTPRFIYGDPMRLKQVLINLTNNAVKFTERGHITIHTYTTNTGDNHCHLCFEIIDTGIGIAQDAQDRIFERFMQEDNSTTRRFGGTGLGISIAKQLIELMGGIIGLSSTVGKGSRFWVELDVSVASEQDFSYMNAGVLIIANNEKRIETWEKLLTNWNVAYVIRNDMESALGILSKWEEGDKKRFILLDESALNMAPVRAAQIIKDIGIKKTSLLLSTTNPMPRKNPEIPLYFDSILDIPVDSRQLYTVLMSDGYDRLQDGVVSLMQQVDIRKKDEAVCSLQILVAEDQPTNQYVFRKILESDGHKVTIVNNGQEACDILAVERFDLALVDLHMPEVSGLDVINTYRFMDAESKMPFVIITANTAREVLEECRAVADMVLIKPINKQHLLDMVYKVSSSKQEYSYEADTLKKKFGSSPLLDMEMMSEMLGDNCEPDFLSELFSLFYTDAKRLVENIAITIYSEETLPVAGEHAHALKGIANNISARRLSVLARHIEQAIISDPRLLANADSVVSTLQEYLSDTRHEMMSYLARQGFNVEETDRHI
ncbi:MAG: ATP-binding protein [Gammaproteobacteria bacterium]|nr:ATP-binding protein [Gammaproteobacteria bacterium]